MIDTTFWGDAALSFNKEAVTSLPSPVIIALTSMKVTQFLGKCNPLLTHIFPYLIPHYMKHMVFQILNHVLFLIGRLQLSSTPASYMYINPEIDLAKTMAEE